MIVYLGLAYVILSSIYTFSFAGQTWANNKPAAMGAVLLVFVSMGLSVIVLLRS